MQRVIVVVEYSPAQGRVRVRGVWLDTGQGFTPPPLLHPANAQNVVEMFLGVTMDVWTFAGLYPKEDAG